MISLDTADLLLLCALRDDSRLSLRDLGAKVSMSAPAVSAILIISPLQTKTHVYCKQAFKLKLDYLVVTLI